MLLKQHLDMIGRNEPIQRKAKFWQSYVRALKGEKHYEDSSSLDSSAAFDAEMQKAVTSYSGTYSGSKSRVVTKKTTSYMPIQSTRFNTEIIRASLGPRDVYEWPDDDIAGEPLYHRPYYGSYVRRPLSELLEPNTYLPRSRITRDPWWYDYPTLRPYNPYLRYPYTSTSYRHPYRPWWRSPYFLRDSYLSPIKRTYLWSYHPVRPFSYNYYWI